MLKVVLGEADTLDLPSSTPDAADPSASIFPSRCSTGSRPLTATNASPQAFRP